MKRIVINEDLQFLPKVPNWLHLHTLQRQQETTKQSGTPINSSKGRRKDIACCMLDMSVSKSNTFTEPFGE